MWGLDHPLAKAADLAVAQVVGQDEDDVGAMGGGHWQASAGRNEGGKGNPEKWRKWLHG
jgi:hypothetical protein